MKKVFLFSIFLLCGLFLSQILPSALGGAYGSFYSVCKWLMFICLAFIMINVGREFELDKTKWKSYTTDYFIAMATAAVPWLLIAFYYIFFLDTGLSWENNLLIRPDCGTDFSGDFIHDAGGCRAEKGVDL